MVLAPAKEEQTKKKIEKPQDDDPEGEKLVKVLSAYLIKLFINLVLLFLLKFLKDCKSFRRRLQTPYTITRIVTKKDRDTFTGI